MIQSNNFTPDWVSPPGDTIIELLDEYGFSIEILSKKIGLSSKNGQKLLDGSLRIDTILAKKLETMFNVSSSFWTNRDSLYISYKLEIEKKEKNWLNILPTSDMVKLGWIPKFRSFSKRVQDCLDFFNEDSIDSWFNNFKTSNLSVAFRKTDTFSLEPVSTYSWLIYSKKISKATRCPQWNSNVLKSSLLEIRELTNEKNPNIFIPKLKSILRKSGIVFIISKTPVKCPINGATCFFEENKATLTMSFRYLSDDQFWFTLFHELGHLLLHPQMQNKNIKNFKSSVLSKEEEREANIFSLNQLVPPEFQEEMKTFTEKDWKKILKFARKVGVSRGIILGQLQHLGNISYAHINKLKTRYKWNELITHQNIDI